MIDFTDCQRNPFKTFNGANGQKISVRYDGHQYMLKFPPRAKSRAEGEYANSCISEYICCQILRRMGMNAQETLLGRFVDNRGVTKTVVACRDFTEGGLRFADFGSLKNTCVQTSENGYGTELDDIDAAIMEQQWIDRSILKSFFWDMFICDAFLGNFDRHNGNWGFLIDDDRQTATIAPIFDCGSCLFPQQRVSDYRKVLDDPREIDNRVFVWPNSAIQMGNKKINYFEYISSLSNPDCNEALIRILPRIDMDAVFEIVDSCEGIGSLQKEFYMTILSARKEKILDYSLERLESSDQSEPRCQSPRDRPQRGGGLQREASRGDVEVVAGDLHDILGDAVRAYAEQERDALTALDHLGHLPERELPLRVRSAGGEDHLPQLGRETLSRIREAVEPAGLRHLQEVLPVTADARGPCDPFGDLHWCAGVLRDREAEEGETHVVRPRKVPCAGYDAPVGLPEILVVRVVESYRDPSAPHRPVLLRPTMA